MNVVTPKAIPVYNLNDIKMSCENCFYDLDYSGDFDPCTKCNSFSNWKYKFGNSNLKQEKNIVYNLEQIKDRYKKIQETEEKNISQTVMDITHKVFDTMTIDCEEMHFYVDSLHIDFVAKKLIDLGFIVRINEEDSLLFLSGWK